MRRLFAVAAMFLALGLTVAAHPVTYRGTVVAVAANPYAASDGVLGTIEMTVAPSRRTMTFDITAYTQIWRGEMPVSFSEARIASDEPIALTWVDEEPEKGAQEIRLGARR